MSDEKKDKTQEQMVDELFPDTWVFTINVKTGRVMALAPNRQTTGEEIASVLVNMNVLMGKVAGMITKELSPDLPMMVEPKTGRKDN